MTLGSARVIYKVQPVLDAHPFLFVDASKDELLSEWWFRGTQVDVATLPKLWIKDPHRPRPDVWWLWATTVIGSPEPLCEDMQRLFGLSGQLLECTVDGTPFVLVNITEFSDCYDFPASLAHDAPVFIGARLPRAPLFLVPDQELSTVYALSDPDEPAMDFVKFFRDRGLQGLRFEKVWSEPNHNPSLPQ